MIWNWVSESWKTVGCWCSSKFQILKTFEARNAFPTVSSNFVFDPHILPEFIFIESFLHLVVSSSFTLFLFLLPSFFLFIVSRGKKRVTSQIERKQFCRKLYFNFVSVILTFNSLGKHLLEIGSLNFLECVAYTGFDRQNLLYIKTLKFSTLFVGTKKHYWIIWNDKHRTFLASSAQPNMFSSWHTWSNSQLAELSSFSAVHTRHFLTWTCPFG